MVSINKTYALGDGEGSIYKTSPNRYLILHETATEAPAVNNASFEHRTWNSNGAYVHFIVGDGGAVYQVGEPGYVAWGAGQVANSQAPVQIELARTRNADQFKKDYAAYIELARSMADQYGIPKTLDAGGAGTPGVKTHKWVTDHIWGDHTDPVQSYLQPYWGITQQQLANDVANGVGSVAPSKQPPKGAVSGGSTFPGFTPEQGAFTVGDQPILVRVGQPGIYAPRGNYLQPGDKIFYDGYKNQDGLVWVHYTGYSGDDLFLPTHPSGTANNLWGTFS